VGKKDFPRQTKRPSRSARSGREIALSLNADLHISFCELEAFPDLAAHRNIDESTFGPIVREIHVRGADTPTIGNCPADDRLQLGPRNLIPAGGACKRKKILTKGSDLPVAPALVDAESRTHGPHFLA